MNKFSLEAARAVGVSPHKMRSDMTRDQAMRFDACMAELTRAHDTRDSDWIARELGDVPHEMVGGWRSAAGTRTPWHGDCIPVESLGRDA